MENINLEKQNATCTLIAIVNLEKQEITYSAGFEPWPRKEASDE